MPGLFIKPMSPRMTKSVVIAISHRVAKKSPGAYEINDRVGSVLIFVVVL